MKKLITLITLLSMSSVAFGAGLSVAEKDEAIEAANYGLCHELKLRPAKGDEKLIEMNCGVFIQSYDLKVEKKALQKRLNQINAEIKKLDSSIIEAP